MKVTKSKLKRIIAEELQHILAEQDTGETRMVPRAQLKKDADARRAKGKDPLSVMDTQEVDMEAVIQKQIDMMEPSMYRPEAERLFDKFFEEYDNIGIERLIQYNDELEEIVSKLGGFLMPDLFRYDRQPSPMFVKVAQEFEKEGIPIINNEDEFLGRVEERVLTLAKSGFAKTGAGEEKDVKAISKQIQQQAKVAAQSFAVDQVIKVLRKEDPERYGSLPDIKDSSEEVITQLLRDVPRVKPKLFKQAYDYYMKEKG